MSEVWQDPCEKARDKQHEAEDEREVETGYVDPNPLLWPEKREPQVEKKRAEAASNPGAHAHGKNREYENGPKHAARLSGRISAGKTRRDSLQTVVS